MIMSFQQKYTIKKKYLTPHSKSPRRRPGIPMEKVAFIVAHDTGNPGSTAEGNVNYYEATYNKQSASAHIFVDDKEIIECIPLLTGKPEKAWHVLYNVTKDNEMYGDDANDVAGGIELCWGKGINGEEAYKRYVWVLAYACYKFGLNPSKHIVGHEILDPGRKIDPSNGLKHIGKTYQQLRNDVIKEYNECIGREGKKISYPKKAKTVNEYYTIQKGDTLWEIAQNLDGISVHDLMKLNPNIDPKKLKVGQKIKIKYTNTKKLTLPNGIYKKGDKGKAVEQIQTACNALNFICGKVDGIYGEKTENAIKRYQSMYAALKTDGIYGPKTKAQMEKDLKKKGLM